MSVLRAFWRVVCAGCTVVGSWFTRHVSGRRPTMHPRVAAVDVEVQDLSDGQLYQAALNAEVLLTAGHRHLSAGDVALLERKMAQCDAELKRRKLPTLDI